MIDHDTQPQQDMAQDFQVVGASAKSIAAHLIGMGVQEGCYPMDGGDFGRCEAMLDRVPTLRDRLPEMTAVNAYWAALVPRWEEIRASNEKTKLIKAIVRPIEDADPMFGRMDDTCSMRGGPVTHKATDSPRMKETEADKAVADGAYRVAAGELRQFVERVENLEAEKADIAAQIKEVFAESKARGYDNKIMKKVIALRKREPDDIAEEEAVLEMYRQALSV